MATSTAVLLLLFASQVFCSPITNTQDATLDDRGLTMNVFTFTAYLNGSKTGFSGQTFFMQSSDIIVDFKITEQWFYGTGSVSMDTGGAGKYSAIFSYDVPFGAELALKVEIVGNKYWWLDTKSEPVVPKITRTVSNSPMREVRSGEVEYSRLTVTGSYAPNNEMSRAIRVIHNIEDKFVNCYGESTWFNGTGTTTLTGGVGRTNLDFNHNVPANASGLYTYECHSNINFGYKGAPKVYQAISPEFEEFTMQKFLKKEKFVTQIYGTFVNEGEDVWDFRNTRITNMTGDGWWTYGKGDFHKQAGGKGHTFLVLGRKNVTTDLAYGYFKYDLEVQP